MSRSGESASGVDEFQTCQFCQEPRPRWSSMCAYTRPGFDPPRLNQLLTDTKDRRRVSHRIKGPRNASAGPIPRDDRALTEERAIANRDPRDIRSPSAAVAPLSPCIYIVLPCIEFRCDLQLSRSENRFDSVCRCAFRKVNNLGQKYIYSFITQGRR